MAEQQAAAGEESGGERAASPALASQPTAASDLTEYYQVGWAGGCGTGRAGGPGSSSSSRSSSTISSI